MSSFGILLIDDPCSAIFVWNEASDFIGIAEKRDNFMWTAVAMHRSERLPKQMFIGMTGLELHQLDSNAMFVLHFTFL